MEIKVLVNGNAATAAEHPDILLTSGSENAIFVTFEQDSSWERFSVDAVFVAAPASWLVTKNPCTATVVSLPLINSPDESVKGAYPPAEFFQNIGTHVFAGLTGIQGDTVKNSDLALLGVVVQGADPELGKGGDLSPTRFEILSGQIGDLSNLDTEDKSSLVAAINEVFAKPSGGGGGGAGTGTVNSVNGNTPDSAGNVELTAEDVGAASAEELNKQAETLTQLSGTVSKHDKEITDLEETASQQSTDIAELTSTVSGQGTSISNLSSEVSKQGTSLTSLSNTVTAQGQKITTLEKEAETQNQRIEALEDAPSSEVFYIAIGEEATDVGEGFYKVDKTIAEIETAYATGKPMCISADAGNATCRIPFSSRVVFSSSQIMYLFVGTFFDGSTTTENWCRLYCFSSIGYPVVQVDAKSAFPVLSVNGNEPKTDGSLELTASDVGAVSTDDFAPETKTEDMTQSVGVDDAGKLWTLPGSGSGGSPETTWKLLRTVTLEDDTGSVEISTDEDGNTFECEEIFIHTTATNISSSSDAVSIVIKPNGNNAAINSTNFAFAFSGGKNGANGRAWAYIKSLNPVIAFYGTWVETNTVVGKAVTVTNVGVGHAGNPFTVGEKITSIVMGGAFSSHGFAAGSVFEVYGR